MRRRWELDREISTLGDPLGDLTYLCPWYPNGTAGSSLDAARRAAAGPGPEPA